MSIRIIKPGLQTSIQDLGRMAYRSQGISQSGAIDSYSLQLANWLVGKKADSPCLEVYLVGPAIEFQENLTIGIAGADFELFINDKAITSHRTHQIVKGDILTFGKCRSGARAYISFAGQLASTAILASYSQDLTAQLGPYNGKALRQGQEFSIEKIDTPKIIKKIPQPLIPLYPKNSVVRVTKGLEFNNLSISSQQHLFDKPFHISSHSNRMGIRLEDNPLQLENKEQITSSPIVTGTIQLPESGNPIITLNEGQTIGGYPRVAQVISADLPLLGQQAPGNHIRFYPVSIEKALLILNNKRSFILNTLEKEPRY